MCNSAYQSGVAVLIELGQQVNEFCTKQKRLIARAGRWRAEQEYLGAMCIEFQPALKVSTYGHQGCTLQTMGKIQRKEKPSHHPASATEVGRLER